jgi:hypothetical protein
LWQFFNLLLVNCAEEIVSMFRFGIKNNKFLGDLQIYTITSFFSQQKGQIMFHYNSKKNSGASQLEGKTCFAAKHEESPAHSCLHTLQRLATLFLGDPCWL